MKDALNTPGILALAVAGVTLAAIGGAYAYVYRRGLATWSADFRNRLSVARSAIRDDALAGEWMGEEMTANTETESE